MYTLLLLLRLFSVPDCQAFDQRSIVVGPQKAMHEAVYNKWHDLYPKYTPGEVSAAFLADCQVIIK